MDVVIAHAPRHEPRDLSLTFTPASVAVAPGHLESPMTLAVLVKTTLLCRATGRRDEVGRVLLSLERAPRIAPWVALDLDVRRPAVETSGGGAEGALIEREGLPIAVAWRGADGEARVAPLPLDRPRLFVVMGSRLGVDRELTVYLHAAIVDEARSTVDLVHRAEAPVASRTAADVDSIVVFFAADDAWSDDQVEVRWSPVFRELPRGRFERATTPEDVEAGKEPSPLDDAEIGMARYSTWGYEVPPSPTMTLARYARVQAELADERETRAVVLERHGLTDYEWNVEEVAFASAIGRVPAEDEEEDGEEPLATSYAAIFAAEQARLESPVEAAWTVDDYARVRARMEMGDPRRALTEARMGLGPYMRLDRRMQERARGDVAFAAAIERALEAERTRVRAEGGATLEDDA